MCRRGVQKSYSSCSGIPALYKGFVPKAWRMGIGGRSIYSSLLPRKLAWHSNLGLEVQLAS